METLPLAIANGWGCGISAYAVVLIAGLVGRSGVADTPEALQRTDVLVAAAVLLAVEFVADKIPYVDSAWDGVHTVVRPAIGGVMGALLAGHENRAEDRQEALADLEADLAKELTAIDDEWSAKAATVETVEVPLERSDVRVTARFLVWVPTG